MPTKFYVDNNFFRLMTAANNTAIFKDWQAYISQERLVPAELIVTHFSLLEGLGIVPEEIPPFGGSLKGMAPGDIGIAIFDHALNFLNSSKIISLDHFRNRYQGCAARCSEEGRSRFSECFNTRSADNQFVEDTRKALALDFMQAYHYPTSIFVPVHMVFWVYPDLHTVF